VSCSADCSCSPDCFFACFDEWIQWWLMMVMMMMMMNTVLVVVLLLLLNKSYTPSITRILSHLWLKKVFSREKRRILAQLRTGGHRSILSLSLCLSVLMAIFPGEPGLAGVYRSKGWWRWWWQLHYWSYKSCKAPVKSSPPTNQHLVFYRPDALPVAQPTVSKHWREKYHIPWTCLPQAHLGSSHFVSDHL